MKRTKKDNPLTVGVLLVAVVGVGFMVYKTIGDQASPPPAAAKDPSAWKVAGPPSANAIEAGQARPSVSGIPDNRLPGSGTTAAGSVAASVKEEALALNVDPFAGGNVGPVTQVNAAGQASVPPAESNAQKARINVTPLPSTGNIASSAPFKIETQVVRDEPVPELVGTMSGDAPRAVFRKGEGLMSAGIGDTVGVWKVVSIRHGRAVVKSGTHRASVSVNSLGMSAGIQAGDSSERVATSPSSSNDPMQMAEMPKTQPNVEVEKPADKKNDASDSGSDGASTGEAGKVSEIMPPPGKPIDQK